MNEMSNLAVSPVRRNEIPRAIATLVLAFVGDPIERWLWPDAEQYLTHFPNFIQAFGGRAFKERTVWQLGGSAAVALWLPPGAEPDGDAISALLAETVSPDLHEDTFAVLAQMEAAHPTFAHWYLPWFGVDAALQGRGLGARLMEHCLGIVDATHQPAYLETPNPRTVPFYERHGFEVVGVAQAGSCPPVTLMSRAAREA
jgi:GNAT superfamily N-acetyltransferase